jgi:long-chain acyl-CoA synthetase
LEKALEQEQTWYSSYPESARRIDESSLEYDHLADLIGRAAQEHGARPAVSTQLPSGDCATLTFTDVDRLTGDFACYLRGVLGLPAGTVVALMSPNCISFLIASLGIFRAGCICTNINPLYTGPEVEHQLRDSGARVLVISDLFGDKADHVVGITAVEHVISLSLTDFFPPLKRALIGFALRWVKKAVPAMRCHHVRMAQALKVAARMRRERELDPDAYREGQHRDDTALYQYTGGTTGRSKGAELTHANILTNAITTSSLLEETFEPGDSSLIVLPLYHITAFALVMVTCLLKGAHGVMIPSPRPPSNLKKAFTNHRITHLTGINTLYAAMLEEPWCTREVLRDLKLCSSGGAAQLVAVAERWEALTGLPIYQGYGLTECAGALTMTPFGGNRPGFAGVPVPLTEVRIVDDSGTVQQPGSPGEIVARGPTIMKGYLNRPEATAEALRDGWLQTGDIGVMDEQGYLSIVDRKKDMILVSGFNVYPNEVEDAIAAMEGVLEVGVIGVPDDRTGEAIKAFVVATDPSLDQAQVIAHCSARLTNYKRPKTVVFIDEIPKSPVGKVLRRELREQFGNETTTGAGASPAAAL